MKLKTRADLIAYCLTLPEVYEDYPFDDDNWTVMRHRDNKKIFAMIFERQGRLCVNIKCDPQWILFWRQAYTSVTPGFHMNKKYWNTVIIDGQVPDGDLERMIGESFDLTKPQEKQRQ